MTEVLLARLDDLSPLALNATNVGSVGTGVFKQKVGATLEFYKLNAASARASIVLNGTDRIDFDVVEAQILLQNLGGAITSAQIGNDAVTFAKLQNIATDRLIGRDTAATGDPEEITVGGGLEFTGTGGIQRSALTGDITASAGSNATVLRNSAGTSVIGRAVGTTGAPADIAASADDQVLARASGVLSFAQISTGMVANNAITYAKIQDISVTQRALGRNTAGAGDPEEVTLSQLLDWVGSAAHGDVLYRDASAWARLPAGTVDQILVTGGAAANPLWRTKITLSTEQALSGASVDFLSIPSWAKRISVNIIDMSTNGTSNPLLQIGDSGGIETTGYVAVSSTSSYTTGFGLAFTPSADSFTGRIVLELEDAANNTWIADGTFVRTNTSVTQQHLAGHKSLSATLDRIRFTTVNGTDTFDAGSINILFE